MSSQGNPAEFRRALGPDRISPARAGDYLLDFYIYYFFLGERLTQFSLDLQHSVFELGFQLVGIVNFIR